MLVMSTRHHTSTRAESCIRSPSMAVNPQRKTAMCSSRYARLVASMWLREVVSAVIGGMGNDGFVVLGMAKS